ncbi:magnesium transporter [Acetivibrio ethanolgignens]|uniref:Magnesium transporter MgtE n=1 Tax=Acetivibrio ethanolgignens TaxID=290052 RepID=A0A0V8QCX1_9FIRM|nr:magnesium transporter [Acetivibrio ethanolgignens]KSV58102.1 magnesium transporter [Acetivibrio ethanolgignens]
MKEKLEELLQEKKYVSAGNILKDMEPADIAILLEECSKEEVLLLYRILPKELAAEVFVEMDGDTQEELIRAFSDKELKEVLDELYMDDTVDIIEEMPANVVKRILKHSDPDSRKAINELLKYPRDSAGSIMTIEYVSLRKTMTVEDAFARIRATGVDKETIYTCYVTETNRTLVGIVSVKTLLLSDKQSLIGDIMDTSFISIETLDDQEDVAKKFDKYGFLAIPVVDKENRLVGIVTFDDAMDVIHEETQEDFEIMAAMTPSEDSYFKTSVWEHAKNRIFWLLFLMLSSTITGSILTTYEAAFASIPLLVSFIPMVMGTGGNCGSQSSTMIIRGLATDEIQMKDFLRAVFKELRIALLVGTCLAVVNGIRVYVFYHSWEIALVLGLTLIVTTALAKSMGCMLPMLAKRLKLDPAIMAAPLISTIVDSCSVFIYFNIAMQILPI